MSKPVIHLWLLDGIGLIISHPSGVSYSNQTGGYACLHPEMEGAFIPLIDELINQQAKLLEYFTGSKWNGACFRGIDEETAGFIDEVLGSSLYTKRLKVNREKLADSHEAWIHITILTDDKEDELKEFNGFSSDSGIVTWSNSD
ncbi:MAG: DUF6210 family protein [Pyrinomonadaceae bacterium]